MKLQEVERKFLVITQAYKTQARAKTNIVQGFLNTHPERTVRVRIRDGKGYITVKGKGNASGTTRFEWEKEIDPDEAKQLLDLCEPLVLEKWRYEVPLGRHVYEVDEFGRQNKGLILAEIELGHEHEEFLRPSWLGLRLRAK